MQSNPMMLLMQMVQRGQNPMQMLQQMAGNNPAAQQTLQMIQGKTPQQMRQIAENMAKDRGIDLKAMAQKLRDAYEAKMVTGVHTLHNIFPLWHGKER